MFCFVLFFDFVLLLFCVLFVVSLVLVKSALLNILAFGIVLFALLVFILCLLCNDACVYGWSIHGCPFLVSLVFICNNNALC